MCLRIFFFFNNDFAVIGSLTLRLLNYMQPLICLAQAGFLSVYLHTYIPATHALALDMGNTGCARKTEVQKPLLLPFTCTILVTLE